MRFEDEFGWQKLLGFRLIFISFGYGLVKADSIGIRC